MAIARGAGTEIIRAHHFEDVTGDAHHQLIIGFIYLLSILKNGIGFFIVIWMFYFLTKLILILKIENQM